MPTVHTYIHIQQSCHGKVIYKAGYIPIAPGATVSPSTIIHFCEYQPSNLEEKALMEKWSNLLGLLQHLAKGERLLRCTF